MLLAGCTQTYTPQPLLVTDELKYSFDVSFCQTIAQRYSPDFDKNSVILGFIQGGAQNVSTAVMNPLATLAGAGGGAISSGAQDFDFFGVAQSNVFKNCLHDKTLMDHSALMANPN